MASRPPVNYSFREYVAHDAASSTKHEYLDGQIYAMAGGSPEHSALIASVSAHLSNQVRGGSCRVHSSDLRIRVSDTGLATYPDVVVVCGPWERDPEDGHTIVNPRLVVEVLSSSTEAYDRGEKLAHYKQVASLRACVLVAQDRRELEVWSREGPHEAWTRAIARSGETAGLGTIGAHLDVDAVYDDAREPA